MNIRSTWGKIAGLAVALVAGAQAVTAAKAQDFYQGKRLNVIVGNTSGSGYDAYGRLITRYMSKYLGGQPNQVFQYMPGAGSLRAAEFMYTLAPKDGTYIGLVIPGALVDPLFNESLRGRYDPTKFGYIGTADSGARLCFSLAGSKVKTMKDAQTNEYIVGATQPGAYARLLNSLAKTKFKIVTGYPGPNEMFMALDRGESDVICGLDYSAVNTLRPDFISGGKANVFIQIGLEPKPALTALGVPTIWDFIEPADKPLVELIVTEQIFQRVFLIPPGSPPEALKLLREAFDKAVKDPELLEEAGKAFLEINAKDGEYVTTHVNKLYAAPKDMVERMQKVIRP
jgi:tripartite-type tricarboxylate transporter receptor subunit TctC